MRHPERIAWIIALCVVAYAAHTSGGWYVKAQQYDAMSGHMLALTEVK